MNQSSNVYYQQQFVGPTQTIETYRYYAQPSTTTTQTTEQMRYYQLPSQSTNSEITYSIQGTQPKFEPVQFLVSASDGTQSNLTTHITTEQNQSSLGNPYDIFGAHLRSRPNQTTTTNSRGLIATVAKQAGPAPYETDASSSMQVFRSEQISQPTFTNVC